MTSEEEAATAARDDTINSREETHTGVDNVVSGGSR